MLRLLIYLFLRDCTWEEGGAPTRSQLKKELVIISERAFHPPFDSLGPFLASELADFDQAILSFLENEWIEFRDGRIYLRTQPHVRELYNVDHYLDMILKGAPFMQALSEHLRGPLTEKRVIPKKG